MTSRVRTVCVLCRCGSWRVHLTTGDGSTLRNIQAMQTGVVRLLNFLKKELTSGSMEMRVGLSRVKGSINCHNEGC